MGRRHEWVHRREESRVFHQDLLSFLRMWAQSEGDHSRRSAVELGMRLGDCTWMDGGELKVYSKPSASTVLTVSGWS